MIEWNIKTYDDLSKDELYTILKFRIAIFMLEQNSLYEDLDNQDQNASHFLAYENHKLIAYGRVNIDSKNHAAIIQRICIHKDYRNQKIGKTLMGKIMNDLNLHKNLHYAELDAQSHLQKFYEKFGFISDDSPYDDGGVMHIRMVKTMLDNKR